MDTIPQMTGAEYVARYCGCEAISEYPLSGPADDCMRGDGHLSIVLSRSHSTGTYMVHTFNRPSQILGEGSYFDYGRPGLTEVTQEVAEQEARSEFIRRITEHHCRWYRMSRREIFEEG